jgi:hypothetical protein
MSVVPPIFDWPLLDTLSFDFFCWDRATETRLGDKSVARPVHGFANGSLRHDRKNEIFPFPLRDDRMPHESVRFVSPRCGRDLTRDKIVDSELPLVPSEFSRTSVA